MGKAAKGSDFERELCKRLSRWWTDGERDDIFWRSSQSGGRATQRTKIGKTTFGSYGDIAAVDPIGAPLIKFFTIELKRGSSYGCPGDLLDFKPDNEKHPWVQCLRQAIRSHEQAGSLAWMMICRRDHRIPIVFLENKVMRILRDSQPMPSLSSMMVLHLTVRGKNGGITLGTTTIMGLPLEVFLEFITPQQIIQMLKNHA